MKKLIYILTLFLLGNNVIYTQPSMTWLRLYNGPFPTSSDNGNDMCVATNGNFYVTGKEFSPVGLRAFVLKLKPNGDTIWTRYLTNHTSGESYLTAEAIVSSVDGGCVITGSSDQPYTCKLDSNGNTVWFRKYGPGSVKCLEIIRTNDGGYVACGDQIANVRDGFLLKIDSLGNLILRRNFKSGFSKVFNSVLQSKNNDLILCGVEYNCELCGGKNFVLTLNSNCDSLSQNLYDLDIQKMIQIENGYLLSGSTPTDSIHPFNQVYIANLSLSGELSNYRIIKDDQVEYLKDLKVINENRYVIVTDTDTLNKRIAGVSVLDSIGNVLHRKIFAVTDYSIFFSILPFNNGDVGFTGTVETHLDRRRDVIVVRSDSNLYVKPVGILPNSNIVIQNFKLYQNYPNPFNPTTKITIEFPTRSNINQNLNIEIKIFDISGKELKSFENNYFNNSSTVIIFDGNNLPSGLYFYSLFIKNKIYDTKKMILIH